MPTGKQIRAARQLVDWSADDLAERVGISKESILNIERGDKRARPATMDKIVGVFSESGIEFTENEGLKRRPDDIEIFHGPERFSDFYDFLYEQVKTKGGNVCLSVTDETFLSKYRKDPTSHYKRMQDLYDEGIIKSFRVLTNKGYFSSTTYNYQQYKLWGLSNVAPTAFYVFGDYLALISFVHDNPPYIVALRSAPIAAAYREAFDAAWNAGKEPDASLTGKA